MNERDTLELMSRFEMSFDQSSVEVSMVSANGSALTRAILEKEFKELLDDAFPEYSPDELDS